jgi:hypothetical protein
VVSRTGEANDPAEEGGKTAMGILRTTAVAALSSALGLAALTGTALAAEGDYVSGNPPCIPAGTSGGTTSGGTTNAGMDNGCTVPAAEADEAAEAAEADTGRPGGTTDQPTTQIGTEVMAETLTAGQPAAAAEVGAAGAETAPGGSLPFTGGDVLEIALLGAGLLAAGTVVARRNRANAVDDAA